MGTRLRPLVDHPAAGLEEFHRFPVENGQPPQITGIAFGRSGRLYVSMIGTNEIAVLDGDGAELRRISSPLFASPFGLAFLGKSLVANGDFSPVDNPESWLILKVRVGDEGLPLIRPSNIP